MQVRSFICSNTVYYFVDIKQTSTALTLTEYCFSSRLISKNKATLRKVWFLHRNIQKKKKNYIFSYSSPQKEKKKKKAVSSTDQKKERTVTLFTQLTVLKPYYRTETAVMTCKYGCTDMIRRRTFDTQCCSAAAIWTGRQPPTYSSQQLVVRIEQSHYGSAPQNFPTSAKVPKTLHQTLTCPRSSRLHHVAFQQRLVVCVIGSFAFEPIQRTRQTAPTTHGRNVLVPQCTWYLTFKATASGCLHHSCTKYKALTQS